MPAEDRFHVVQGREDVLELLEQAEQDEDSYCSEDDERLAVLEEDVEFFDHSHDVVDFQGD